MSDPRGEITELLTAFRGGDREAFDRLVPLVYDDLRRIARAQLRGPAQTLNTTALVHEAWLRLVDQTRADWNDRNHFLCVCARAMRQIAISEARRRTAIKRGGGERKETLDEGQVGGSSGAEQLLELERALERLEALDPDLARVVECRHFAGMTGEETAAALDLSARTVERRWVRARAWLRADLSEDQG